MPKIWIKGKQERERETDRERGRERDRNYYFSECKVADNEKNECH